MKDRSILTQGFFFLFSQVFFSSKRSFGSKNGVNKCEDLKTKDAKKSQPTAASSSEKRTCFNVRPK